MDSSTLRRATSADAAAVRALTRAAYAKWIAVIGREPLPMQVDYERAVVDHMIDLYEDYGQLCGLVEMVPGTTQLGIDNLCVHPDKQGKGIGSGLVTHAEGVTRSMGLTELRLFTNASFASNIAFYKKRGFVEYLREPFKSAGLVVHMKKVLD